VPACGAGPNIPPTLSAAAPEITASSRPGPRGPHLDREVDGDEAGSPDRLVRVTPAPLHRNVALVRVRFTSSYPSSALPSRRRAFLTVSRMAAAPPACESPDRTVRSSFGPYARPLVARVDARTAAPSLVTTIKGPRRREGDSRRAFLPHPPGVHVVTSVPWGVSMCQEARDCAAGWPGAGGGVRSAAWRTPARRRPAASRTAGFFGARTFRPKMHASQMAMGKSRWSCLSCSLWPPEAERVRPPRQDASDQPSQPENRP